MERKSSYLIRSAAFTYIGTIVGAGFATGREIVEFFTQYGLYGVIGILIAGMLFVYLGVKIMLISLRIDAHNMHEFLIYILGERFGNFFNIILTLMLIGVSSVMLSGTGAVFYEQLHLSPFMGTFLFILLCYFIVNRGMDGLHWINSIVVPCMILFSVTVLIIARPTFSHMLHITPFNNYTWIFKALAYVSFNLSLSIAVFVPLAHDLNKEGLIKYSGILGGIGLTILLLFNNFAVSMLPNFINVQIPTAQIIQSYNKVFHIFFVCVILGEIFTTLAANQLGLVEQFQRKVPLSKNFILIILLIISLLISQFQYSILLAILYPLFGFISLIIFIMILFKKDYE